MPFNPESLRYIFGLKLRKFRRDKGLGLKEMARASGVSVSYLSEIEKGRKYPKPDKILVLARALGVSFDDLVSLRVDDELAPVRDLFGSPFLQEFPFQLFGLELETVLDLVTKATSKGRALLHTALEIGRIYGMRVEHFLFAALRSYQHQHQNYFEDIEDAATAVLEEHGWQAADAPAADDLRRVLEEEHGYRVRYEVLGRRGALEGLRSVRVEGEPPTLLVNDNLLPAQKAFALARELGYLRLGLEERSATSSPVKVESFDQVINDFKAAYFAGAVLISRDLLLADVGSLLKNREWSAEDFLATLRKYRQATPETFFYRLSQLLPTFFGLREMFFLRFNQERTSDEVRLTKILNMSQLSIGHGLGPPEHHCRRWAGLRTLRELAGSENGGVVAQAQRAHFLTGEAEFFVLSVARPLRLAGGTDASVSLGFLIDGAFKRKVRFWNDAAVPQVEVNLACERCGLEPAECAERAAPPDRFLAAEKRRRQEEQLRELIRELQGGE